MHTASRYGSAELAPREPVVAGSLGTWQLVFRAGALGVDEFGTIKVAWRWATDWAVPQFDDPAAADYVSLAASGGARLRARFDPKGHVRPWHKALVIDVEEAALAPGDTVTVVYGDRSGGSPGMRAQTFCERAFAFKVLVDATGSGVFAEVGSPSLAIVNGAPAQLVVTAPTTVGEGAEFSVSVRADDTWGNPCRDYGASFGVRLAGARVEPSARPAAPGVTLLAGLRAPASGASPFAVEVEDATGLAAESNPILRADGQLRPFWGDLHGQSEETVGTGSLEEYVAFARDYAALDFAGHQGNDFQITAAFWAHLRKTLRAQCEPGRFVPFLGYEWSGTTPSGGDRNVYFAADDGPLHRSSHELIDDGSDEDSIRHPVEQLFASLRALGGEGARGVLVVPHVGGRHCDIARHDPELEPLVEIYSAWGEFEWLLREAIERRYAVGFVAGSDEHKGRPGASHPGASTFGVRGGLTCVWAEALTRETIWEALRARRCYATSGRRIFLRVEADGRPMGSLLAATQPPEFAIEVAGTAGIERVELFRGLECIASHPDPMPRDAACVRITWSGARIRGRGRTACWHGRLDVQEGRIEESGGYAFDTPLEQILSRSPSHVAWQSTTAGDGDGVILRLDGDARTVLSFRTDLLSADVALGDIQGGPVVFELGGVDLRVVFELLPLGAGGRHVRFSHREAELPLERTPYWVRVTQCDGAKAWSSPIQVEPHS